MKILVTGSAGFIGFHLVRNLLQMGHEVYGIDNINDYYSVDLKLDRIRECGIDMDLADPASKVYKSSLGSYTFERVDLLDMDRLANLFESYQFDHVVNLAAQAGIRYSTENPRAYLQSNVEGFFNILECCRMYPPAKLVFASSSSVYGLNEEQPFATAQKVDTPINIYAASKKSNELMAHAYSHLYGFTTVGLRFFTVYGPWGRPDMAPFLFADAILNDRPIKVFNNGEMRRDFTYIDDIVAGIIAVIGASLPDKYQIYNIGNGKPVGLLDFIQCLEKSLGRNAVMEMHPIIAGDIVSTWADTTQLEAATGYRPQVEIASGVKIFAEWYRDYFKK